MTILDDLIEIAATRKRLVNRGCSIVLENKTGRSYVSGLPYELTGYAERAFVFASVPDAEAFIGRHFDRFSKYNVHVHEWATA